DIGDDRYPFPLRDRLQADPEILPSGAGEAAADLVIEPDLLVPLQRSLHQRLQDLVAVLIRDPPLGDDRYDIVREPLDKLDHRSLLVLPPTAPREAARPPSSRAARFVINFRVHAFVNATFVLRMAFRIDRGFFATEDKTRTTRIACTGFGKKRLPNTGF